MWKKRLRKTIKTLLRIGLILLITLVLFEVTYRYQWIDFYKSEWQFHTKNKSPNANQQQVLVFGDSFTADANGWIAEWEKNDSTKLIWNAALPGIGPETQRLIFQQRIAEVNPQLVIIQLYVGNDLYDNQKPVNWSNYSFGRNLFWSLSNQFRVLNFVNYRLGQFSSSGLDRSTTKKDDAFDVKRYSERTKLYIKGDGNYPANSILLSEDMVDEFEELKADLLEMKAQLPANCQLKILIIPDCTQVHRKYIRRYRRLGSKLTTACLQESSWSKALKNAGFELIDPLSHFQQLEQKGTTLYFENDPHLSAIGQQELAIFIQQELAK